VNKLENYLTSTIRLSIIFVSLKAEAVMRRVFLVKVRQTLESVRGFVFFNPLSNKKGRESRPFLKLNPHYSTAI